MKNRKTRYVLLVMCFLLTWMTACHSEPFAYTLRQDRGNVTKVEIWSHDRYTEERERIAELNEEETEEILDELLTMVCREYSPGDHPRRYGPAIICIIYADGEKELLGITNIGLITKEGREGLTEYYFESSEAICDLISQYVDADRLPDLSGYYSD